MTIIDMGVGIGVGILNLIIGLALSMGSIYLGLKMFDRMTPGIDEMDELKKGNAAVGILMAAVVLSIANVVEKGVGAFSTYVVPGMSLPLFVFSVVMGVIYLVFGIIIAVFSIYVALKILDKITVDINELEEFKQGNIAIAIMEAGVLIAVSFVMKASIGGILDSSLIAPTAIAAAFGIY
ncbi:MAG: DUF350 domain-containing protein [Candidatus Micrarchaeota archaeon]